MPVIGRSDGRESSLFPSAGPRRGLVQVGERCVRSGGLSPIPSAFSSSNLVTRIALSRPEYSEGAGVTQSDTQTPGRFRNLPHDSLGPLAEFFAESPQDPRLVLPDGVGGEAQVGGNCGGLLALDDRAPERLPGPLFELAADQVQGAAV